jgi:threonine dehydrogenase-like Zn-dependent dehydrogenase
MEGRYTRAIIDSPSQTGSVFPLSQEDFPLAIDMISQGRVGVEALFSTVFPLAHAALAFEASSAHKDREIKVLISMDA